MTFSEEQVEWIVVEVIRRLGLLDGSAGIDGISAGAELVLAEKVVTMRSIEGQLSGVSRLIVPAKTVVTPAVKDELRARQVQLIRKP